MLNKIRVLVVDDSAFMRVFISDMINGEPDLEVVGTARNGDTAMSKLALLNPDVITLDVEMPGKSGLEVLKDIKKESPAEVIMLSSLTSKGSSITIQALEMGAFDFIQKPSATMTPNIASIREELATKIRYAARSKKGAKIAQGTGGTPRIRSGFSASKPQKINAVALGASTGGPKLLHEIISKFPKDMQVPIFVVQHMPAGFTKAFANRLNNSSSLEVVEARNGDKIKPGLVYVAPGGFHMMAQQGEISLDKSPPIHGVRPAVDKLFESAANMYGSGLLCCVFTGMGRDGARGVEVAKEKGGIIIAQDEETSVIYGMPKAAYETGCVDLVLPCDKIAQEIIKLVIG